MPSPLATQVQVTIQKDGTDVATATLEAFLRIYQPLGYSIVNVLGTIGSKPGGIIPGGSFVPQLEAQKIWAYGHSYLATDLMNTAGANYLARLYRRSKAATLTNNAVAGTDIGNAGSLANGNTAAKWVAGTKAYVHVDCLFNQFAYAGFTSDLDKRAAETGIRLVMAALSHASKVESSAMATGGGTWVTDSTVGSNWSAGSAIYTTTVGAWCEAVVTVNSTGKVDVVTSATDPTFPFATGNFSIYVDGVLKYAGNSQGWWQDTGAVNNGGACPQVITLAGLTPGAHTIRVVKEAGASYLFIDCFLVRSATPPPIGFCKHLPMVYSSYSGIYGIPLLTEGERQGLNDLVDLIATEFPNVLVLDASEGWDPVAMIGPDAIHPNDHGMGYLADAYEDLLARYLPWTPGLHTGVAA